MAVRFLILFVVTNSFAVGAFSALVSGGVARSVLGVALALLALAGSVVTARVVVLARPARGSERVEMRRLRSGVGETVR
jgi:hypothetical protein